MSNEEIKALHDSIQTRKPTRVKKFKEEYINDNAVLRQENHVLNCKVTKAHLENAYLLNQINNPSIGFALGMLWRAIVGKEVK